MCSYFESGSNLSFVKHKLVLQKTSEYGTWCGASDSVMPEYTGLRLKE
jgi:hypothetical protein